jgi:hypothetical protein
MSNKFYELFQLHMNNNILKINYKIIPNIKRSLTPQCEANRRKCIKISKIVAQNLKK